MADGTTPLAQLYRAYEQVEGQLSAALDQLVATNGFADLLATSATNVMAMTRMVNGAIDRAVRSTRLAARQDVTELARQLARTEDKLERLLQAVEELQARLEAEGADTQAAVPHAAVPQASVAKASVPKASVAKASVPKVAANGRAPRGRVTPGARRPARKEPT